MTENLLMKLEEKVMVLVTELEDSRKEIQRLKQENSILRSDKVGHTQKLQGLISLLDAVDIVSEPRVVHEHVFMQERVEEAAAV